MAGFTMLLKLLAGAALGGAGMGSGQGRMAGQGLAKGLVGSAVRGLVGGKRGMGGGKGCGQGGGQGRCGGGQGVTGERLVKIVELVTKRLAERNAGQSTPVLAAEETPGREPQSRQTAQPEDAGRIIEAQAVAMTTYACRMCGRRITVAADDPIADPRCPQCGGPMDAAPEA